MPKTRAVARRRRIARHRDQLGLSRRPVDWERLGELVRCRQKPAGAGFKLPETSPKSKVQSPSLKAADEIKLCSDYFVVTDRWQKFTETAITPETLKSWPAVARIFGSRRGRGRLVPGH